jgi:hypothetical protein
MDCTAYGEDRVVSLTARPETLEDSLLLLLLGQRTFRASVANSRRQELRKRLREISMIFIDFYLSVWLQAIKNPPFGGSGLAADRSPSLERCVFARFEAGQLRYERNACFNIEGEVAPIGEHDADSASFICSSGLNVVNDLALELGKRGTPCALLLGRFTLAVSHRSPFKEGDLSVRAAFVRKHGAARLCFKGDCGLWQGKSELPKNYENCPINLWKWLVIGQSHREWQNWSLFVQIPTGSRRKRGPGRSKQKCDQWRGQGSWD